MWKKKNKPILTVYHNNVKIQFIRSNNGGKGGDSVGGFSWLFLKFQSSMIQWIYQSWLPLN